MRLLFRVCFPLHRHFCNNINQMVVLMNVTTDMTLSHHLPVSHITVSHARASSLAHSLKTRSRSFVAKEKKKRNTKLQTIPELMQFFTIRFGQTCFAAPPSCWGDTDEN